MIRALVGYLRTIRQYLKTPKGRHDAWDFFVATLLVLLVSALIWRIAVAWHDAFSLNARVPSVTSN